MTRVTRKIAPVPATPVPFWTATNIMGLAMALAGIVMLFWAYYNHDTTTITLIACAALIFFGAWLVNSPATSGFLAQAEQVAQQYLPQRATDGTFVSSTAPTARVGRRAATSGRRGGDAVADAKAHAGAVTTVVPQAVVQQGAVTDSSSTVIQPDTAGGLTETQLLTKATIEAAKRAGR